MTKRYHEDPMGENWLLDELDASAREWDEMPDRYKPMIVAPYWGDAS